MLLIYCNNVTARVKYTFKVVFKDILGVDYQLTSNKEQFINCNKDAKLVYGDGAIDGALFLASSKLLFEQNIKNQNIKVIPYKNTVSFFETQDVGSILPFDIFAATFYLVTRYEEYGKTQRDRFDRYLPEQSLAFKNNFLNQPVVNIWAKNLLSILLEAYPFLILDTHKAPKYRFFLSIDIDSAYSYKGKGILRNGLGLLRYLFKMQFKEFFYRVGVLFNKRKDPYDTYEYLNKEIKKYDVKTIFFLLLGDYAVNDKNLPYTSSKLQSLIKALADEHIIGIHPSFQSNTNNSILKEEIRRLESIIHRPTVRSRQHFLKLKLPMTYRNLIMQEITHDYTMGYPNYYGFRAGICTRYTFYDLELELETPLRIHPFAYMDNTFQQYLKKSVQESQCIVKQLIDEVKAVDGTFIAVWHNHSINNEGVWTDWRQLLETTLEYGK